MKSKLFYYGSFILLFVVFFGEVNAQQDNGFLTTDRLYETHEFQSERMAEIKWIPDGTAYTWLEESKEYSGAYDVMLYDMQTRERSVYIRAERLIPGTMDNPLKIEDYSWSPDKDKLLIFTNSERVWRYNTRGDYWVFDLETYELYQLGKNLPASSLMFAKFSPDGTRVGYVSGHNLYVEYLSSGKIKQLTHDGSENIINGTFDWAYEEEFSCRDGFRWSPGGKKIAYWKLNASKVKEYVIVNRSDSLYPYISKKIKYPKAGETLSACKVGVIPANGGQTVWMQTKGDPRNHYIPRMEWAANSEQVIIQYMNRLQNTNNVLLGDAETGKVEEIMREKDKAWLDPVDDLQWMPDGKHFTWVSQRTGWRHIYLVSRDGKEVNPITKGNFDVIDVLKIDTSGKFVYYIASPENAAQRYLFRVEMGGKAKPQRLSPVNEKGFHSYDIAPGAGYAIHRFSAFEKPHVTELIKLPSHEKMRVLVDNNKLRKKYNKLQKTPVEFYQVTIEDSVDVDGYIMKPPDFDPSKKYPVLVYVYNEPAGQTVQDRWGGSSYLWHLMLTQKGYIVMSMDTRGTPAPKGRAWRKYIYKYMYQINAHEHALAMKQVLNKFSFIDPERVAIWGWSGGGTSTLNALFRYPEIYKTGMAVASKPVPHLYDAIYEERYMSTPQRNPEGYSVSSSINYAGNLEGDLLIVHGSADDNVHYQGAERLINELIKHNKKFTMMTYPNRTHGIHEGENTSRHLRYLLLNYLTEHLKPGGKAPQDMK